MTRFPKDPDDVRMSLGEHLEELRRRIILALLGFGAALALCFAFGTPILRVLIKPVDDAVRKINVEIIARRQVGQNPQGTTPAPVNVTAPEPSLVIITPIEGFTAYLKAAMVGAIAISSPWVLYQFWLFVAAGLYPHERRIIHIFVPFSAALFMGGAVFSYMVVVRYGLYVLLTFGGLLPVIRAARILFRHLGLGLTLLRGLLLLLVFFGQRDLAAFFELVQAAIRAGDDHVGEADPLA